MSGKLVTGELLTLAATQVGEEPENIGAVVWVMGKLDGSIGIVATGPLDPWTVVSMLAAGIERVVAGEVGLGSGFVQEDK